MFSGPNLLDELFEGSSVDVALEVGDAVGIDPFGRGEIDRLGPRKLDVRPRRVEMRVVGHVLAAAAENREQNSLGRSSLVRGNDVLETGQLADLVVEAIKASRAGVRLVAPHDAGPLIGAHGRRAAVGQQVDQHVLGTHGKEVVAALPQDLLPIADRGKPDRFDRLDLERLDDRLHGCNKSRAGKPEGWEADAGCRAYSGVLFRATLPNRSRHSPSPLPHGRRSAFFLHCHAAGVWFSHRRTYESSRHTPCAVRRIEETLKRHTACACYIGAGSKDMPKSAATIFGLALVAVSIGFNIWRYPIVWRMSGPTAPSTAQTAAAPPQRPGRRRRRSSLRTLPRRPPSCNRSSCLRPSRSLQLPRSC